MLDENHTIARSTYKIGGRCLEKREANRLANTACAFERRKAVLKWLALMDGSAKSAYSAATEKNSPPPESSRSVVATDLYNILRSSMLSLFSERSVTDPKSVWGWTRGKRWEACMGKTELVWLHKDPQT